MVVGSGLLARAFSCFTEDPNVLVFASGVSNSTTATQMDYAREQALLLNQRGAPGRLIYFSTCSLFDPKLQHTGYLMHKRHMESLIRAHFPDHLILRLPNLVGFTSNPHTLCNYLRDRICSGEPFTVQAKACRHLMDVALVTDFATTWLSDPTMQGLTVNMAFDHPAPLPELVQTMEAILGIKARTEIVDAGSCYPVENEFFRRSWEARGTSWPEPGHWKSLLARYYGNL